MFTERCKIPRHQLSTCKAAHSCWISACCIFTPWLQAGPKPCRESPSSPGYPHTRETTSCPKPSGNSRSGQGRAFPSHATDPHWEIQGAGTTQWEREPSTPLKMNERFFLVKSALPFPLILALLSNCGDRGVTQWEVDPSSRYDWPWGRQRYDGCG